MSQFNFTLSQKAKSKGGDKYTCDTDPNFSVYLNQEITRVNNEPKQKFIMTITFDSVQKTSDVLKIIKDNVEFNEIDEDDKQSGLPIVSDIENDPDDVWFKLPENARPKIILEETDCESGGPSGNVVYRNSKGHVLYTDKMPKKVKWDHMCELMVNEGGEGDSRRMFRQLEIAYIMKMNGGDSDLFDTIEQYISCL